MNAEELRLGDRVHKPPQLAARSHARSVMAVVAIDDVNSELLTLQTQPIARLFFVYDVVPYVVAIHADSTRMVR